VPRQIIFECDYGCNKQSLYPRVLDFNESLFWLVRGDKWISFPLSEIDKTTGQCVHLKSARRVRWALARIEKLIGDQGLAGVIRMTVVAPPS
jgi:hypothetical protein